jgi:hypothetical protein
MDTMIRQIETQQERDLRACISRIREVRNTLVGRTDLPPGERLDRFILLSNELLQLENKLMELQISGPLAAATI